MHFAIARPWFGAIGTLGRPVQLAQEGITRAVYEMIRLGARVTALGIDAKGLQAPDRATSFVNGLWGDSLDRYRDFLETSMSVRRVDDSVATGRLVVLVHGLMATERSFEGADGRSGLLNRLLQEPGLTPVVVRYNTGLAIETNGRLLADELDAICADWPVPIEMVALVGHSMGGLVIEHARLAGQVGGHGWADSVTDVVNIAAPYQGAPLEKLVSLVSSTLRLAPQTKPLAEFLDTRSQGIKDLRSGEHDWPEYLHESRHHFVAGVITADPTHPMAALVGDLMVQPASSTGAAHVEATSVTTLGGVNHFDLLGDPAVVEAVMGWLTSSR